MNPSPDTGVPDDPLQPMPGVDTPREIVPGIPFPRLRLKSDAEVAAYLQNLEEEKRQRVIEALQAKCNAPSRHWKRTEFDRSGEWGKLEKSVLGKLGKGGLLLALIGVRGNGKTQIGVEAIRYMTGVLVRPARFVTVTEFLMELKATYGENATEREVDVVNRYRKYALVVMDEFGRRAESDWENRIVFEVVNWRYANEKDTILIANQERAAFLEAVGPSIASRMIEAGALIDCTWPSFRKPQDHSTQ